MTHHADYKWGSDNFLGIPATRVEEERTDLTIGELAREFGVTLRALRFYESKGLIAPRRAGPARLYTAADRERLGLILAAKKLGFSLVEIRHLMADGPQRKLQLDGDRCLAQIDQLETQKRDIEAAIIELRRIHAALAPADEANRVAS